MLWLPASLSPTLVEGRKKYCALCVNEHLINSIMMRFMDGYDGNLPKYIQDVLLNSDAALLASADVTNNSKTLLNGSLLTWYRHKQNSKIAPNFHF